MKKIISVFYLFYCILLFSQKKIDTIQYTHNETVYKEKAMSFVKKMIEANVKYGGGRKDLIYDTIDLEVITYPIFNFKKSITDADGKSNLVQYVEFKNNPEQQIFEVYYKKKIVYTFYLPNNKLDEIAKGKDNSILMGDLSIPLGNTNGFSLPDYKLLLKNQFSFYIENAYCILINSRLFVVEEIMFPSKYLKIEEFNHHFFPDLNLLKAKVIKDPKQKVSHFKYKAYQFKGTIAPTVLKVVYQ